MFGYQRTAFDTTYPNDTQSMIVSMTYDDSYAIVEHDHLNGNVNFNGNDEIRDSHLQLNDKRLRNYNSANQIFLDVLKKELNCYIDRSNDSGDVVNGYSVPPSFKRFKKVSRFAFDGLYSRFAYLCFTSFLFRCIMWRRNCLNAVRKRVLSKRREKPKPNDGHHSRLSLNRLLFLGPFSSKFFFFNHFAITQFPHVVKARQTKAAFCLLSVRVCSLRKRTAHAGEDDPAFRIQQRRKRLNFIRCFWYARTSSSSRLL